MSQQMSFYRNHLDSLRFAVSSEGVNTPKRAVRALLIDDDSSFLRIMERAALLKGISLTICASAHDAKKCANGSFDVAIVDYMLGSESGLETVARLEKRPQEIPVILVSQAERIPAPKDWPGSMREFVHKRLGPFAIIEAALEAVEIADLQRKNLYTK